MNAGSESGWDAVYRNQPIEKLPWYYDGLDPDIDAAVKAALSGERRSFPDRARILDLGTGPATQAIALAEQGYQVVGSDISPAAVDLATAAALRHRVDATFAVDDILDSHLEGPFDLVVDRGCFHVLARMARSSYAHTVARILSPGGRLILKCFSYAEPGEEGPHRLHPDDIRLVFAEHFEVESVTDSEFSGPMSWVPKALVCVMRKL